MTDKPKTIKNGYKKKKNMMRCAPRFSAPSRVSKAMFMTAQVLSLFILSAAGVAASNEVWVQSTKAEFDSGVLLDTVAAGNSNLILAANCQYKGRNPVLGIGTNTTLDDTQVFAPSVLKDGNIYFMWYAGNDGSSYRILLAVSTNGTTWQKVGTNAVLNGGGAAWDGTNATTPSVIKDGDTYKMWYAGLSGTVYRIGYATSPDGTNWTKYAGNPVLNIGSGWEANMVLAPTVVKDGETYKMWYTGKDASIYKIGYATSPDGTNWTKYVSNPVLTVGAGGTWDDGQVSYCSVMKDDATFRMLYSGYDGTAYYQIGLATSPDGTNWTKSASNPVLTMGASGTWDAGFHLAPSVMKDGAGYKAWYTARNAGAYKIGYATSPDSTNWTKFARSPALDLGANGGFDDASVQIHGILKEGATIKTWFSGYDGATWRIGYATSPDGTNWTKLNTNGVLGLGPNGAFDDAHIHCPSVINDEGTYKMWYAGHDGVRYRIGYATSSEGTNWTKLGTNCVLDVGSPGTWETNNVSMPCVIKDGATYKMWYGGAIATSWQIGYATSPDGTNWTKYTGNPVLRVTAGAWDATYAMEPWVIKDGDTYKMWYAGVGAAARSIGYATSPDGTNWTKHAANPVLTANVLWLDGTDRVEYPRALQDGADYLLWYSGSIGSTAFRSDMADSALYPPAGTIASQTKDCGELRMTQRIYWNEYLPSTGCDISLELRATQNSAYTKWTPDSVWPWTVITDAGGDNQEPVYLRGRYLQWRVMLTSTNATMSPQLFNVSLEHGSLPKGTIIFLH